MPLTEPNHIARDELFQALDRGLALSHEFDGGPLAEKLGVFGLDVDDVAALVEDRYEQARSSGLFVPREVFAQALVEGLLAGLTLGKRR
jgi:TRAP-type mannitol/chloroaromatic compound transport system substrate-binding protein